MIVIGQTNVGRGVFASEHIPRGTTIVEFVGPLIDLAATQAKGEFEGHALQIGPDLYIDCFEPAVLVNHSCEPNAGMRDDRFLFALRDIAPGEEIRFDYSTTMEDGSWVMQCHCGTASCRGLIGDFSALPAALRQRYVEMGIVQRYLLQQGVV